MSELLAKGKGRFDRRRRSSSLGFAWRSDGHVEDARSIPWVAVDQSSPRERDPNF